MAELSIAHLLPIRQPLDPKVSTGQSNRLQMHVRVRHEMSYFACAEKRDSRAMGLLPDGLDHAAERLPSPDRLPITPVYRWLQIPAGRVEMLPLCKRRWLHAEDSFHGVLPVKHGRYSPFAHAISSPYSLRSLSNAPPSCNRHEPTLLPSLPATIPAAPRRRIGNKVSYVQVSPTNTPSAHLATVSVYEATLYSKANQSPTKRLSGPPTRPRVSSLVHLIR